MPTGNAHGRRPRRWLFLSLVLALSVGGSACVIRPSASGGDVTFYWDFGPARLGCSQVPGVAEVVVDIAGERLENDGVYGCANGGVAGITLFDFAPGTYDYTLWARDQSGAVLYQASGTFRVDGSISVPVTLIPSPSATGSVYLTWSFPGGRRCSADPAITTVQVSFDQGTPIAIPCSDGQTTDGALVSNLYGGAHQIDLLAMGASGFTYYAASSTLDVYPGGAAAYDYQLDWAAGGLAVRWRLWDGQTELTCAQAHVTTVYVNLVDPSGHFVYDPNQSGVAVDCVDGQGLQGTVFPYLSPGTYQVLFQARPTVDQWYSTDQVQKPTASVSRGVFPALGGQSPVYDLVLQ